MRQLTVTIEGVQYPARLVMGALLLYRRETGEDVSAMRPDDVESMLRLMWCCIKCASQAAGQDFPYDFETFCNSITPQDVEDWNAAMADDGGKKKATASPVKRK